MSLESFLKSNFTGTGYFKALFGAGVGFNLWHFLIFYFTPSPASRTDGNLWSHVGNMFLEKSTSAKTQNSERAAKVKNYLFGVNKYIVAFF